MQENNTRLGVNLKQLPDLRHTHFLEISSNFAWIPSAEVRRINLGKSQFLGKISNSCRRANLLLLNLAYA
jgi:hypothetical protein